MIQIKREIRDQIIEHAMKELPNEACGFLAGLDGVIIKAYELTNVDRSPEHFSFDPAEQFKVFREVRRLGLNITANYHSHPSTPSRPSEEDIRLANDPNISYVIISLAEKDTVIRSFRMQNSISEAEEIEILN
jgi:proteasome lid subunit RPN8/RPN11